MDTSPKAPAPARFEHEAGTWAWRVDCAHGWKWGRGVDVEVGAAGGERWVSIEAGHDPVYLDQARLCGLLVGEAVREAKAQYDERQSLYEQRHQEATAELEEYLQHRRAEYRRWDERVQELEQMCDR